MNIKIFRIVIVVLLVAFIALLSTVLVKQNKIEAKQKGKMERREGRRGIDRFESHFKEQMNFNDEQLESLREKRTEFHDEMSALFKKQRQLQQSIYEVGNDSVKAQQIADKMGELSARQHLLRHYYMLSVREICNEEQKVKLDSITKNMMHQNKRKGHEPRPEKVRERKRENY